MLLGFQRRFAPYILDGSKTHTIRGMRKYPFKPGDRLDCYVDPRRKSMQLLGRFECVKVESICISAPEVASDARMFSIAINGDTLSPDEMNELAWRDGFRGNGRDGAIDEMARFWTFYHALPFVGRIIHWKYSREALNA